MPLFINRAELGGGRGEGACVQGGRAEGGGRMASKGGGESGFQRPKEWNGMGSRRGSMEPGRHDQNRTSLTRFVF